MQQSLIPYSPPRIGRLRVLGSLQPGPIRRRRLFRLPSAGCKGSEDGAVPEHTLWALALGDVSGKGMAAALFMARLESQVRLLFRETIDPARIAETLDRHLCETGTADRFITFLLAILDADCHELTVLNAGHNAPLLRHSDGRVESIDHDKAGIPLLGIDGNVPRESYRIRLDPGQAVVFYTDGFLDALDPRGNAFGLDRLRDAIASSRGSARQIGEAVLVAVAMHTAGFEQFDDMTILCFARANMGL